MSIGFTNPINGSGGMASVFVIDKNSSGGAIKGYMPQTIMKTDKDYKCNNEQRKGKLFKSILKLEDETSTTKCEEKNCAKVNYMDDCIDLGEEQCRIKYKDLIENIEKTKKKKILPLSDCMGND